LIKKIKGKFSWVKIQGFLKKYFWCFWLFDFFWKWFLL